MQTETQNETQNEISMEQQSINFDENIKKFEDIKDLCQDDHEFHDLVMKISLLEVILGQVNEIFIGSLYNEQSNALIDAANTSIESMQKTIVDTYIKNSRELNELMPVPDIEELSTWVEEVHYDIARQLYTEGFCDTVIYPALQTITESVVEFANEENQDQTVENNIETEEAE